MTDRRSFDPFGARRAKNTAAATASAPSPRPSPRYGRWVCAPNDAANTPLVYDFGAFHPRYYTMTYPNPDANALARRVAGAMPDSEPLHQHPSRGLDHGAWVPLLQMYPEADIPVAQLSLQPELGPAHHLALGRSLAPLRQEGVLVIGSGSFTHNLGELRRDDQGPEPSWVASFADWFDAALREGRTEDLADYRRKAPAAARNHPTDEHLLPLYVPLGMGGRARRLHASTLHRALRMDAYAFEA